MIFLGGVFLLFCPSASDKKKRKITKRDDPKFFFYKKKAKKNNEIEFDWSIARSTIEPSSLANQISFWVLMGWYELIWVGMGYTGFHWVEKQFSKVPLGCSRLKLITMDNGGLKWVVVGYSGL